MKIQEVIDWYLKEGKSCPYPEVLIEYRATLAGLMFQLGEYVSKQNEKYLRSEYERKLLYAETLIYTEGTGVIKEATALIKCKDIKEKEITAEVEYQRTKLMLSTCSEVLNAMASQIRNLENELKNKL